MKTAVDCLKTLAQYNRWLASPRSKTPSGPIRRWMECRREPVADGGYRWLVSP